MLSRVFQAVLLLGAITAIHAQEVQPTDSPEVLRFLRTAELVMFFQPPLQRNRSATLGEERNWCRDLYTVVLPLNQPANVGLLFRKGRDERVWFFNSDTVHGTFHGRPIEGMLEDEPKAKMEDWKRWYAQTELASN
jgi:hypothetical protein